MTKRRTFYFFKWVGPAHMLFSGCDNFIQVLPYSCH